MYTKKILCNCQHAGAGILVSNEFSDTHYTLNTHLEAVAIKIQMDKRCTVCSVYFSPNYQLVSSDWQADLLTQLEYPYIIMGDLNAGHPYWGDGFTNSKGWLLKDVISSTDLDIVNDGCHHTFSLQTCTSSCIDLSLLSGFVLRSFSVECSGWPLQQWPLPTTSVDDAVNALTATILSAGDSSIPKTKGGLKTKYVPRWTLNLSCYRREKNDMLREYRRSSLILHKIEFMKARVKFRKSVKELRQQSWQNFISSINAQTHDLLHSGLVAQHHLKNVGAACLIHAFQK